MFEFDILRKSQTMSLRNSERWALLQTVCVNSYFIYVTTLGQSSGGQEMLISPSCDSCQTIWDIDSVDWWTNIHILSYMQLGEIALSPSKSVSCTFCFHYLSLIQCLLFFGRKGLHWIEMLEFSVTVLKLIHTWDILMQWVYNIVRRVTKSDKVLLLHCCLCHFVCYLVWCLHKAT